MSCLHLQVRPIPFHQQGMNTSKYKWKSKNHMAQEAELPAWADFKSTHSTSPLPPPSSTSSISWLQGLRETKNFWAQLDMEYNNILGYPRHAIKKETVV